jgi:AcrR family transcriptional regulator
LGYFPSKDDLLTALIIDGYNALGEAVERADAAAPPDDHPARWLAFCRAVRAWALAHPHEYALLYGSPVPGYSAPQDTVTPAMRDTIVFGRIVSEAHQAGTLRPTADLPQPSPDLTGDMANVREVMPTVPDDILIRAITAWAGLFGLVGFELFGQFNNVITHRATFFDHAVQGLAVLIGLTGSTPKSPNSAP